MWQPIETAPENSDSVPVLLWDARLRQCVVGRRFAYPKGWIVDNSYGWNEDGQIDDVTHWMPTPPPP